MLKVPDGDKYKIFGLYYYSKIAAEGTARTFGDFNPFTYQELGAARAYHRVIEILGLRRFLRRFGRACSRAIESATIYMEYNYHGEEPPLTAEEMHRLHVKPDDKVIVWGASRG